MACVSGMTFCIFGTFFFIFCFGAGIVWIVGVLTSRTCGVDVETISGVEVATGSVEVAIEIVDIAAVAVAAVEVEAPRTAPPPLAGFENDCRSEPHVFPSVPTTAYSVAQMRVFVSLDVGSTPPSDC